MTVVGLREAFAFAGVVVLAVLAFVSAQAQGELPTLSIAGPKEGSWQNGTFHVRYDAGGMETCRLETKDGEADWKDRGAIPCGAGQTARIDSDWCQTEGENTCGVRITGIPLPNRSWIKSGPGSYSWRVPSGVSVVHIDLRGAQGGNNTYVDRWNVGPFAGGKGGRVQTTVSLSPGDTLNMALGAQPLADSRAGGMPGGGSGGQGSSVLGGNNVSGVGGGGFSELRVRGVRYLVAGAGGGASAFSTVLTTPNSSSGGHGGGLAGERGGGAGQDCVGDDEDRECFLAFWGGGGGTQTTGGDPGPSPAVGLAATAGGFGFGGTGAFANTFWELAAGGGGGGGYYGGGGGGTRPRGAPGGGGGGSSYADPAATDVVHTRGFQEGHGEVILQWSDFETRETQLFSIDVTAPVATSFEATDGKSVADISSHPLVSALDSVQMRWAVRDDGSGVDKVEVWRQKSGESWELIETLGSAQTHYEDSPGSGDWRYGIHAIDEIQNCITESGGHCGGVTADRLDQRSELGPLRVVFNTPPVVSAGEDREVNLGLPFANVALRGSAADDGLLSPLVFTWSLLSGPEDVTFENANELATTAAFSASGEYELQLQAHDGGLSGRDFVKVRVLNARPFIEGLPPSLEVPFASPITLTPVIQDDGLPNPPRSLSIQWAREEGPGDATFSTPEAASTEIQLSQAGTHVVRVDFSDGELSDFGTIKILYGAPPNFSLVPCGVIIDNPDTPHDETKPCQLGHILLLVRNLINFTLWWLVPVIITLLLILTGAVAYFSFGGPDTLATIKRIWSAVGKGVLILLFSWLFLNFLLGVLGFNIDIFGRWTEIAVSPIP